RCVPVTNVFRLRSIRLFQILFKTAIGAIDGTRKNGYGGFEKCHIKYGGIYDISYAGSFCERNRDVQRSPIFPSFTGICYTLPQNLSADPLMECRLCDWRRSLCPGNTSAQRKYPRQILYLRYGY